MTVIYRRNLPHIHPQDATFFITFRLAGSLPLEVLERLQEERRAQEQQLERQLGGAALRLERYKFFGRYDGWLDRMACGPTWLRDPVLANMVAQEIRRLDGVHYDLLAYCIMPNHVHLLVDRPRFAEGETRGHPSVLSRVLHLLKGRTARYANQYLSRSGKFWQEESYDHFVRNEKELERIVQYILNNPVKAGLVEDWRDWPHSYVAQDLSCP